MDLVNRPQDRRRSRPRASQGALFDTAPDGPFAGVVFNRPLDDVFTYRIPEGLRAALRPGARVRVPLGKANNVAIGHVVRVDDEPTEGLDPARVKDVLELLDESPLIDAT